MKLIRTVILLIVLASLLLSVTPVYADTSDPDSTPKLEGVNAYRNTIESGDMLLLIYANIPYSTVPDTPVTQTFIWSLLDTDNVTELGSTIGSNYNDDGYGYNVFSMYWSAAEFTAAGMVWGTVYTIRLAGNPTVFDTPPVYNFTLTTADYSAETVRSTVQAELGARILVIATDLDNQWGLTTTTTLLTENETATVLSTAGSAFFRGAIFGLQAMAPDVFSVVIRAVDLDDREWDTEYSENITAQWGGSWVDTAKAAGAALFGTDYDLLSIILMLVFCVSLFFGNLILTGDHWNGMVDVAVLAIIGARLAMYDLAFLMLAAFICWIYISAKLWRGLFP